MQAKHSHKWHKTNYCERDIFFLIFFLASSLLLCRKAIGLYPAILLKIYMRHKRFFSRVHRWSFKYRIMSPAKRDIWTFSLPGSFISVYFVFLSPQLKFKPCAEQEPWGWDFASSLTLGEILPLLLLLSIMLASGLTFVAFIVLGSVVITKYWTLDGS